MKSWTTFDQPEKIIIHSTIKFEFDAYWSGRLDHLLQELDMMACRADLAVYATVRAVVRTLPTNRLYGHRNSVLL